MTTPDGTLLADDARTAERPYGPCHHCDHAMLTGQRIARLLTGKWSHTLCIGQAHTRPRRR